MDPEASLFLTNFFGDSDAQSGLRTIIPYPLEQGPPNSYLGVQWTVFLFNSHLSNTSSLLRPTIVASKRPCERQL